MSTDIHLASADKSTNVRSRSGGGALALLGRVAPGLAERRAVEAFATPPVTTPAPPEVPGLRTHQFWVDFDDRRLSAYDWGDSGPTILLCHGWGGTAAQLSGFVRPLLDAGFHVLAFDQPAHGASAGRRANVVDFARATAAVAAKVDRVHGVVAHSLGATAAALALGRGLVADRLVLLAAPVEVRGFVRRFGAALALPPARIDGMLRRLAAEVGDLDRLDLRLRAPALTSAALVVHDPRDREVPFAHAVELAAAWPAATLRRADRLGHRRLLADLGVIRDSVTFLATHPRRLRRSA